MGSDIKLATVNGTITDSGLQQVCSSAANVGAGSPQTLEHFASETAPYGPGSQIPQSTSGTTPLSTVPSVNATASHHCDTPSTSTATAASPGSERADSRHNKGFAISNGISQPSIDPVLEIHAFFSTECGKYRPRPAPLMPLVILRSNYDDDVKRYVETLRTRFPILCWSIFADPSIQPHGWDIRWFFDQYDFAILSGKFCIDVINTIVRQNEDEVIKYSIDFHNNNPSLRDFFHVILYGPIEKLFPQEDFNKRSEVFLRKVQTYMQSAFERAFSSGLTASVRLQVPPNTPNRNTPNETVEMSTGGRSRFQHKLGVTVAPQPTATTVPMQHTPNGQYHASPPYMSPHAPGTGSPITHIMAKNTPDFVPRWTYHPVAQINPANNLTAQFVPPPLPPFAPGPVPYPHIWPIQQHHFGHQIQNQTVPPLHKPFAWQAPPEAFNHNRRGADHHGFCRDATQFNDQPPWKHEGLPRMPRSEDSQPPATRGGRGKRGRASTTRGVGRDAVSTPGPRRFSVDSVPYNFPHTEYPSQYYDGQGTAVESNVVPHHSQALTSQTYKTWAGKRSSPGQTPGGHSQFALDRQGSLKGASLVEPNYISQDIHDIFDLWVGNVACIEDYSMYHFFGQIAPIVEVFRSRFPGHAFLRFESTDAVRAVLLKCNRGLLYIQGVPVEIATTNSDRIRYGKTISSDKHPNLGNHEQGTARLEDHQGHQSQVSVRPAQERRKNSSSYAKAADKGSSCDTTIYSPQDARSGFPEADPKPSKFCDLSSNTDQASQQIGCVIAKRDHVPLRNQQVTQGQDDIRPQIALGAADPPKPIDLLSGKKQEVATSDMHQPDPQKAEQIRSKQSSKSQKKKPKDSKIAPTEQSVPGVSSANSKRTAPFSPDPTDSSTKAGSLESDFKEQLDTKPSITVPVKPMTFEKPNKIEPALPKSFAQVARGGGSPTGLRDDTTLSKGQTESPDMISKVSKDRSTETSPVKNECVITLGTANTLEKSEILTQPPVTSTKHGSNKPDSPIDITTHESTDHKTNKSTKLYSMVVGSPSQLRSNQTNHLGSDKSDSLQLSSTGKKITVQPHKNGPTEQDGADQSDIESSKTAGSGSSLSDTTEIKKMDGESSGTIAAGVFSEATEQCKALVISGSRSNLAWEKDCMELHNLAKRSPIAVRDERISEVTRLEMDLRDAQQNLETMDSKLSTLTGNMRKKLVLKRRKKSETYKGLQEDLALKLGQYHRNEAERQQQTITTGRYNGAGKGEQMALAPYSHRLLPSNLEQTNSTTRASNSDHKTTRRSSGGLTTRTNIDRLLEDGMDNHNVLDREITLRDGEEFRLPQGYTTKTGRDLVLEVDDLQSDESSETPLVNLQGLGISTRNLPNDASLPETAEQTYRTTRFVETHGRLNHDITADVVDQLPTNTRRFQIFIVNDPHAFTSTDATQSDAGAIEAEHSKPRHTEENEDGGKDQRQKVRIRADFQGHAEDLPNETTTNTGVLHERRSNHTKYDDIEAMIPLNTGNEKAKRLVGSAAQKILDRFDLNKDEDDNTSFPKENKSIEAPKTDRDSAIQTATAAVQTSSTSPTISVASTNSQTGGISWAKVASQGMAVADAKKWPSVPSTEKFATSPPTFKTTSNPKSHSVATGNHENETKSSNNTATGTKDIEAAEDPWAVQKGNTWGKKGGRKRKGG